eukprot:1136969-Pyramimonas_sp.AAC.1
MGGDHARWPAATSMRWGVRNCWRSNNCGARRWNPYWFPVAGAHGAAGAHETLGARGTRAAPGAPGTFGFPGRLVHLEPVASAALLRDMLTP